MDGMGGHMLLLPLSPNGLMGIVVTGDVCPVSFRQFQGSSQLLVQGEQLVESSQLLVCMLGVGMGKVPLGFQYGRHGHHLEIGFRRLSEKCLG
jgi:hypothetical protein